MSDGSDRGPPAPRPMADDATDVDDTVADHTLIVDVQPTRVETVPRHAPGPIPRPIPMDDSEAETLADHRPGDRTELDELADLWRAVARAARQGGQWLHEHVLRPGWRGLGRGYRRVVELLRGKPFEDSDAYSRRRGQQWRRFREGDPSINELREFDEKYRGAPRRDRQHRRD